MTTDPNVPIVPGAPMPASPPDAPDPSAAPAPGPGAKGTQSPVHAPAPPAEGQGAEGELEITGEGYALSFPEGLPPSLVTEEATGLLGEFGILAKAAGVPLAEADRFVRLYTEVATTEGHAVNASSPDSVIGWLHHRWGEEFDAKMGTVHATVQKLGPRFSQWLEATRLGDDPAVLVALAEFGAGTSKLPRAEAQRQLDEIMSDPKHGYWHGSKSSVDRVRLLSEIAYAETSEAEERAKERKREQSNSPTARLDAEIKLAEQDAAYYDSGHPGHRQAVERVTRLYRQRWGE